MMVENHNRKMTLSLLDQCTELIRSLAAAVGTNKVTFLERFNAHQKLIDRSGARDGDPEELSAAIDQATEALYGKDPGGDGPEAGARPWRRRPGTSRRAVPERRIAGRQDRVSADE